jgi:hypothetical protein
MDHVRGRTPLTTLLFSTEKAIFNEQGLLEFYVPCSTAHLYFEPSTDHIIHVDSIRLVNYNIDPVNSEPPTTRKPPYLLLSNTLACPQIVNNHSLPVLGLIDAHPLQSGSRLRIGSNSYTFLNPEIFQKGLRSVNTTQLIHFKITDLTGAALKREEFAADTDLLIVLRSHKNSE